MSKKAIYSLGGAVQASGGIYLTRQADRELLDLCQAGKFAYVLAPRQVGKTSLMYGTAKELANINIRSVIVDLSAIGTNNDRDQWYCSILSVIADSLQLQVDIVKWWNNTSYSDNLRLSNFFKDILLQQVSERVVVFFDEIDTTLDIPFSDDFFVAIRSIYNARPATSSFERLSFVLVGTASPSDLIQGPSRTPFNIGQAVDLPDFSFEEALPLIQGLGKSKKHAKQVLEWIFEWTNGHPYLTQKLCALLSARDKTIQEADVINAMNFHILGKQGKQDDNLDLVQSKLKSHPRRTELIKLYKKILEGEKVSQNVHSIQNQLSLIGLVKPENGFLIVRNRIYQTAFDLDWVKQNTPKNVTKILAVGFAAISLALLSIVVYDFVVASLSSQYAGNFYTSRTNSERLKNLANLFELRGLLPNTDYDFRARELFYSLNWEDQISLFRDPLVPPSNKQSYLTIVVEGLYVTMANIAGGQENSDLLRIMKDSLKDINTSESIDLQNEINLWLEARNTTNNEDALATYDKAILLNNNNPATHYERAVIELRSGLYEQALLDLDKTMQLAQSLSNEASEKEIATPTQWPTRPEIPETSTSIVVNTLTATQPFPASTKIATATSLNGVAQTPIITPGPTKIIPTSVPTVAIESTKTPRVFREGYKSSFYSIAYIRSAIDFVLQEYNGKPDFDYVLKDKSSSLTNLSSAGLIKPVMADVDFFLTGTAMAQPRPIFTGTALARQNSDFAYIPCDPIIEANLRRSPGYLNKNDQGDVLLRVSCGQTLSILRGPVSADGLDWWYIEYNGFEGWIAETTAAGRTILVFTDATAASPPTTPIPTFIQANTNVYVTSNSSGKREIYHLSESIIQITSTSSDGENWSPVLSRNGNLYFTSNRDGKAEIYRLLSSGEMERITHSPGSTESWSPALDADGNLYFTSNRDGKAEIYMLTQGQVSRVTQTPGLAESWSPALSANKILYFTSNRTGKAEIYRLTINGQVEQVTNAPGSAESWSAAQDGNGNLYFTSNRTGKAEIYRLNTLGETEQVTISQGETQSWSPAPDAEGNLYFTSNRNGNPTVFILFGNEVYSIDSVDSAQSWTGTLDERIPGK